MIETRSEIRTRRNTEEREKNSDREFSGPLIEDSPDRNLEGRDANSERIILDEFTYTKLSSPLLPFIGRRKLLDELIEPWSNRTNERRGRGLRAQGVVATNINFDIGWR